MSKLIVTRLKSESLLKFKTTYGDAYGFVGVNSPIYPFYDELVNNLGQPGVTDTIQVVYCASKNTDTGLYGGVFSNDARLTIDSEGHNVSAYWRLKKIVDCRNGVHEYVEQSPYEYNNKTSWVSSEIGINNGNYIDISGIYAYLVRSGAEISFNVRVSKSGSTVYSSIQYLTLTGNNDAEDRFDIAVNDEDEIISAYGLSTVGSRKYVSETIVQGNRRINGISYIGDYYGIKYAGDQLPPIDGVLITRNETEEYFSISVYPNNDQYGMATGSGSYEKGTKVEILATPFRGYSFVKWSDGDVNHSRVITVSESVSLEAIFVKDEDVKPEPEPIFPPTVRSYKRSQFPYVNTSNDSKCLLQSRPIKLAEQFKRGFRVKLSGLYDGVGKWAALIALGSLDAKHWQPIGIKQVDTSKGVFHDIGCTTERGTWKYAMVIFAAELKPNSKIDTLQMSIEQTYNNKLK